MLIKLIYASFTLRLQPADVREFNFKISAFRDYLPVCHWEVLCVVAQWEHCSTSAEVAMSLKSDNDMIVT